MNNKIRQILSYNDSFTKQLEEFQINIFHLNEILIKEKNRSMLEKALSSITDMLHTLAPTNDDYDKSYKNFIADNLASVQLSLKKIQLLYSIHSEDIYDKMVKKVNDQLNGIKGNDSEEERKDGCS